MCDHRSDAGCLSIDVKQLDFFLRVGLGRPLTRRLGEDLNGVALDRLAQEQGFIDSARDRHVSAEQWAARSSLSLHNNWNG